MAKHESGGFGKEMAIHFIGGAIGGTAGTALTCPFEVIKTRMQSVHGYEHIRQLRAAAAASSAMPGSSQAFIRRVAQWRTFRPRNWLWLMAWKSVWREGRWGALYKGLGPNLVGVTPSKAIYFATYSISKRAMNSLDPDYWWHDTALVHMLSAGIGGFITASIMNPIWVVKTRLQLHKGKMGTYECYTRIKEQEGFWKGLWKGVTGSYMGIVETMVQFVLYEWFRGIITDPERQFLGFMKADAQHLAFAQFMLAGGVAKTGAVIIAYPHEIFRTRLREEGNQLRASQIFLQIWREDWRGFYRGLSVQLIRSVPNTALTMFTYELVVHGLHNWLGRPPSTASSSSRGNGDGGDNNDDDNGGSRSRAREEEDSQ